MCRKQWAWVHGFSLAALQKVSKEWHVHQPGEEVNIETSYGFSDTTYHAYSFETASEIFRENGIAVGIRFSACVFLIQFKLG